MSDLNDCGFRADWYAYVFVGTISAITPAAEEEKKIRIMPDEIFHGEPPTPLTVLTSQGACLPPLVVGDRWLFFLRKENGKPIVLDYYGNDSRPIAKAQEQIETLRRLKTIADFGIIRGNVMRGPGFLNRKLVAGAHVVASRPSDNTQFFATTDGNGYYEFKRLPLGKYELVVDSTGPSYVGDAALDVTRAACWDVTLWNSPDGRLSGHVTSSDGLPEPKIAILIMREDGSWFTTQESDADGYYHQDSLRPGEYIVGINLPGAPVWKYGGCGGACQDWIPDTSLYYPGMDKRSDAIVITLTDDEKRDDINFVIPTR